MHITDTTNTVEISNLNIVAFLLEIFLYYNIHYKLYLSYNSVNLLEFIVNR